METSMTMREYLAEIYRLQEDSPTVSTTNLADRLNVSAPAVPRMLKRLKSAGFVEHVPYQGVELTPLGRKEALHEIRRHRILEVFLVSVMGFRWDEVHLHSETMGKGLTDAIVDRMAEMTHRPSRCPHGEPIPDEECQLIEPADQCVMNEPVGFCGKVSRVRTHDPDKLKYFAKLGLVPGAEIELVGRAPFNGPLRFRLGREDVVIGAELTKSLWVSRE